jgi:hypothetical protein
MVSFRTLAALVAALITANPTYEGRAEPAPAPAPVSNNACFSFGYSHYTFEETEQALDRMVDQVAGTDLFEIDTSVLADDISVDPLPIPSLNLTLCKYLPEQEDYPERRTRLYVSLDFGSARVIKKKKNRKGILQKFEPTVDEGTKNLILLMPEGEQVPTEFDALYFATASSDFYVAVSGGYEAEKEMVGWKGITLHSLLGVRLGVIASNTLLTVVSYPKEDEIRQRFADKELTSHLRMDIDILVLGASARVYAGACLGIGDSFRLCSTFGQAAQYFRAFPRGEITLGTNAESVNETSFGILNGPVESYDLRFEFKF